LIRGGSGATPVSAEIRKPEGGAKKKRATTLRGTGEKTKKNFLGLNGQQKMGKQIKTTGSKRTFGGGGHTVWVEGDIHPRKQKKGEKKARSAPGWVPQLATVG